ncbi:HIT family protein [Kribbella sp. CA-247076]|uniref:HIT family protein n=1 Tax=Kribbella sp. CA-247076 TaxID=3239941 RepID=UPI003D8CCA0E
MFNHEPADYDCPFCRLIAGGEDGLTQQQDIVRRTKHALAFIASRWWPNNPGHVLVFPRYDGDELCSTRHLAEPATPEERAPYARHLRAYFSVGLPR